MERDEVKELHYLTAVANLGSILERGILCHETVTHLEHVSVASPDVQRRRATRRIPGGLQLHQYANVYFNARNAMLYRILHDYDQSRRREPESLAILRISPAVLDLRGVVVTDINAAADVEPRWFTVSEGLPALEHGEIHAESWNDPNPHVKRQRMQRMMAEVLVPRAVPPGHVRGAYVVNEHGADAVTQVAPTLDTEVNPYMYFRGGGS